MGVDIPLLEKVDTEYLNRDFCEDEIYQERFIYPLREWRGRRCKTRWVPNGDLQKNIGLFLNKALWRWLKNWKTILHQLESQFYSISFIPKKVGDKTVCDFQLIIS